MQTVKSLIVLAVLMQSLAGIAGEHVRSDGNGGYYTDEGHYRSDGRGGLYKPDGGHQRSDGRGGYYDD